MDCRVKPGNDERRGVTASRFNQAGKRSNRTRPERRLDRIFLEQTRDHRRVEICPHSVDGAASEMDHPAISVVEPHSVLRRRLGVKLHDSLIILHEEMFDDKLGTVWQNLVELREGSGEEIRFRLVVTGKRMCAFDDPVDLVVNMLEKARAVALLETLEDLPDVVFRDHKSLLVCFGSTPYVAAISIRSISSSRR